MTLQDCFQTRDALLMEGALGERLKREYGITFDDQVAMAALLYAPHSRAAVRALWLQYAAMAKRHGLPFLATTTTRRANKERVAAAGLTRALLADNVRFLQEVREEADTQMYAGGLMGCRGDAYTGVGALSEAEAKDFHAWQAEGFAEAGADFLYAAIMPTLPEAKGMARALAATGLPYLISFTIRKDGRLIDGTFVHDAIQAIDAAAPSPPLCYMANCVHPAVARAALTRPRNRSAAVRERFKGLQANTSPLPYAELDGAGELHCLEPEEFAQDMLRLKQEQGLKILGGCCGTDLRHMEAVARGLVSK